MRKLLTHLSILIVLLVNNVYSDCDYIAIVTKDNTSIGEIPMGGGSYDDPMDYFDFLIGQSPTPNDDGYGLVYYDSNVNWSEEQTAYFTCGYGSADCGGYDDSPIPMDTMIEKLFPGLDDSYADATIFLGHVRDASTGTSPGSHPFKFELNGNIYHMMHNGGTGDEVKSHIFDFLWNEYGSGGGEWFEDYPSQWAHLNPNTGIFVNYIDSELMFHYFMYWIIENDGDIVKGLFEAMNQTNVNGTNMVDEFLYNYDNILNFMLTDGNDLYIYKNTPNTPGYYETHYNISIKEFDDFYALKSQANSGGQPAPRFQLVQIPRDGGNIIFYDPFTTYSGSYDLELKTFHSGWNWVGFPILENNEGVPISEVFYSITQQPGGYIADHIEIISTIANADYSAIWVRGNDDWDFGEGEEFDIDSFHGYKVKLPDDYEHYTIPMSGTQISQDATLSFDAGRNMVPYFRHLSHGVFQTLPQEVQDVLVSVRAEDWFMSKNSDGTWKIPSNVPHGSSIGGGVAPLRYGKAYEMTFTSAVEFQWQPYDWHEHYVQKRAEHFSHTKNTDYIPMYIDGIDSEEDIEEVGAFIGLECVGAEVVDGYPVGMKLYTNYQNIEDLTFQVKLKENGLGKRKNIQDEETIYRQERISDYSENRIRSVDLVMITAKTGQDHQANIFSLVSAYPNPFNPNTNIRFNLKEETRIELSIYDIQGNKVVTLIRGNFGPGSHSYLWDGTNEKGHPASSGLYLYQLRNTQEVVNQKIMLLK